MAVINNVLNTEKTSDGANVLSYYPEMMDDREINLRILFYSVLKQWRRILAGAVIAGLILCCYAGIKGYGAMREAQRDPSSVSAVEKEIEEADKSIDAIRTSINDTQNRIRQAERHYTDSEYFKIDPYNTYTVTLTYAIKPEDNNLADGVYQSVVEQLIEAYTNEALNAVDKNEEALGIETDIGSIYSLADAGNISSSYSTAFSSTNNATIIADTGANNVNNSAKNNNLLTLCAYGSKEETAVAISEIMKRSVDDKHTELNERIGTHTVTLVSDESGVYYNSNIEFNQLNYSNLLSIQNDQILKIEKQLDTLISERDELANSLPTRSGIIKKCVKYSLIGFVAGLFLLAVYYFIKFILSSTLQDPDEIRAICSGTVIDVVPLKPDKNDGFLDRLIAKLYPGKFSESAEKDMRYLAGKLSVYLKGCDKAAFAGTVGKETCEQLIKALKKYLPEAEIIAGGDPLSDLSAVEAISSIPTVIIEKRGESKIDNIVNEIELLSGTKADCRGFIVL